MKLLAGGNPKKAILFLKRPKFVEGALLQLKFDYQHDLK